MKFSKSKSNKDTNSDLNRDDINTNVTNENLSKNKEDFPPLPQRASRVRNFDNENNNIEIVTIEMAITVVRMSVMLRSMSATT